MLTGIAVGLAVLVWATDYHPWISSPNGRLGQYNAYVIHSRSARNGGKCILLIFDRHMTVSTSFHPDVTVSPNSVAIGRQGLFIYGEAASRWDRDRIVLVYGFPESQLTWKELPVDRESANSLHIDGSGQVRGLNKTDAAAIEAELAALRVEEEKKRKRHQEAEKSRYQGR